MRKRLFPALLAALLLLSGCVQPPAEEEKLHILCTTYPVYLFTTALTQWEDGVAVDLLVNSQTSCLHDYTLTVKDMKAIEKADVIVMNGAGLEDFMADALAASDAAVIDCSEGIELLPILEHAGHDGHEHEEEYDPHFWMDPNRALTMRENIARSLQELTGREYPISVRIEDRAEAPPELSCPYLITFHDGFQYFADSLDLTLLKAVEEEEGATASASEIREIVSLIEQYRIPAIFVEKNGSRATAEVIARETGCAVYELDMLMSGEGTGLQPYLDAMNANLETIWEALL